MRPIHSGSVYAYKALSLWVASFLKPLRDSMRHVLRTSRQFVISLHRKRCTESSALIRLDWEDYYRSGQPCELASAVMAHLVHDPFYTDLVSAVTFLLEDQYVTHPLLGQTLRSVLGSGMGLTHSSILASCAIYNLAEKEFLQPARLVAGAINGIWRYEDDYLIHSVAMPDTRKWFHEFCKSCGFF